MATQYLTYWKIAKGDFRENLYSEPQLNISSSFTIKTVTPVLKS